MAILHLMSGSPHASGELSLLLQRVQPGDGLLLMRDAAYALTPGTCAREQIANALGRGVSIFCLAPDLEARGLELPQSSARIGVIDYAGFVALTVRFPRTCSW